MKKKKQSHKGSKGGKVTYVVPRGHIYGMTKEAQWYLVHDYSVKKQSQRGK